MSEALLVNSLLATALAGVVWICARFVRNAAVLHVLWVVVLVKLFTPAVVELDVIPRWDEPVVVGSQVHVVASSAVAAPPARGIDFERLFYLVWLGGSLGLGALAIMRIRRFRRLVARSRPASDALQRELSELGSRFGLRRVPELKWVDAPISPLVWFRPGKLEILAPAALFDRLGADERRALLLHELAHVARRDHWVRLLELAATVVFWWQPVVWWARRELRRHEEQACDARVLALASQPRAYARALLETVEFLADTSPTRAPLASGATDGRALKERLQMIVTGKKRPMLARGHRILLALGAALCLLVVPTWVDPPQAGEDDRVELDRRARDLEQQLAEIRLQQRDLELAMARTAGELETVAREDHARELEQAGRLADAARVRSEAELVQRQRELELAMIDVERQRAHRLQPLERELHEALVRLEQAEASGDRKAAEQLRRRVTDIEHEVRSTSGETEAHQRQLQDTLITEQIAEARERLRTLETTDPADAERLRIDLQRMQLDRERLMLERDDAPDREAQRLKLEIHSLELHLRELKQRLDRIE